MSTVFISIVITEVICNLSISLVYTERFTEQQHYHCTDNRRSNQCATAFMLLCAGQNE